MALKRDTITRINSCDYSPNQIKAWLPDAAIAQWHERLDSRFVVVAEADGQVVGFGDVGSDGHIDQFYGHADHQRQTIGRALLAALVAQAVRLKIDHPCSQVSITASTFFAAQGFKVERQQIVVVRGVEFVNFRMSRAVGDLG